MLRISYLILFLFSLTYSSVVSKTNYIFVGDQIPSYINLNSSHIITNSDTLKLNNKILKRQKDYSLNKKFKRIELNISTTMTINDSLFVTFTELPSWLLQKYGNELPSISSLSKSVPLVTSSRIDLPMHNESDITINGSKSFRFSTSKSGSSDFNQTLDLNLSGHLAKNLTLKGTISDRGYNPSYGSSNSRLNELDKINLSVESPNFKAQIGDIVVLEKTQTRQREKKISGLNMSLHNENVQLGMTAARPKGQFKSMTFFGQNQNQGPYQIKPDGERVAIIPGSESVWLDGVELIRGAGSDYILDYPNGQLTFNIKHLIDDKSRIVIDFEPLTSEYKQEYLRANSKANMYGSGLVISFDWIREGDDKDENLSQQFSESDKELLANLNGDEFIFKSGLISDTLGDYQILFDSLPDTVYQYVGENLGMYDVRFSYVDSANGAYLYQGSNRYLYVGNNNGDYLPIIIIKTPKRTDYMMSSLALKNTLIGELKAEWNQSRKINNLFAQDIISLNKNYYNLQYAKKFNNSQNEINALYRNKQNGYTERSRVNLADYKYKFYIPFNHTFSSDEEIFSINSNIQVHETFSIQPDYSSLKYKNQFESDNKTLGFTFSPLSRTKFTGNWQDVKTDFKTPTRISHGESKILDLAIQTKLSNKYTTRVSLKTLERTNDYETTINGFAYDEYMLSLSTNHSEISYQLYTEDTLLLNWQFKKERQRVQLKTENKFKKIDYKLLLYFQNTKDLTGKNNSLFTRSDLNYTNRKQNIHIQSSYLLSNETRFTKGIRYLEVNDGEGDYIFTDSQYVPEAGGNFILVEELLSDSAPVKRGEKSFSISKKWNKVNFKFNSYINEELFATESRSASWVLPFYSNSKLSYLFFNSLYHSTVKLFPISGGYFVTLNLSKKNEKRYIASSSRIKESFDAEIILNQKFKQYYVEEAFEYYNDKRDVYYYRAGEVDGYALSSKVKRVTSQNEYALQIKYRSAKSSDLVKSNMYMIILENRLALFKNSEIKIKSEFYKANKNNFLQSESYLLTDNRPGNQGAVWSMIFRAKIKKLLRLNFSIQGRHSDINKARIFARTEFIANF